MNENQALEMKINRMHFSTDHNFNSIEMVKSFVIVICVLLCVIFNTMVCCFVFSADIVGF